MVLDLVSWFHFYLTVFGRSFMLSTQCEFIFKYEHKEIQNSQTSHGDLKIDIGKGGLTILNWFRTKHFSERLMSSLIMVCELQNYKTPCKFYSRKHPEVVHPCQICGKKFPHRWQLVKHEKTHTGEKNFVCNECGKGFVQNGGLSAHIKVCYHIQIGKQSNSPLQ